VGAPCGAEQSPRAPPLHAAASSREILAFPRARFRGERKLVHRPLADVVTLDGPRGARTIPRMASTCSIASSDPAAAFTDTRGPSTSTPVTASCALRSPRSPTQDHAQRSHVRPPLDLARELDALADDVRRERRPSSSRCGWALENSGEVVVGASATTCDGLPPRRGTSSGFSRPGAELEPTGGITVTEQSARSRGFFDFLDRGEHTLKGQALRGVFEMRGRGARSGAASRAPGQHVGFSRFVGTRARARPAREGSEPDAVGRRQ